MAIYLIYQNNGEPAFETHSTKLGAKAAIEKMLAEGMTLDQIKVIVGDLVNPVPLDVVKTVTI